MNLNHVYAYLKAELYLEQDKRDYPSVNGVRLAFSERGRALQDAINIVVDLIVFEDVK